MANFLPYFAASGPVVGFAAYLFDWPVVFWIGVGLAVCYLLMSGKFSGPLVIFMIVGALFLTPWYFGVGIGVLVWSALAAAFAAAIP